MKQKTMIAALRRCSRLSLPVARSMERGQHAFMSTKAQTDSLTDKELMIPEQEATRFMKECMEKVGTPSKNAERIALNLVAADVRGHFSHGLNRLSMYIQDIKAGTCDPTADPKIIKESPATAWVDGKNGLGVVVGEYSMKLAIQKAKESGVGWVCAKNSNHFGMCQWYTDMALEAGVVGMAATNTSPLLTPTRAKTRMFGTNPIAVAAPAKSGDQFTLDMATSTAAVGKIEMQMRKKEPLPTLSWALGADGKPTQNAEEAFHRGSGLMPLGGAEIDAGYKGYGLAMVVELLCGLMAGASYGPKVRQWTFHEIPANLGQCFIAVDQEKFAPGLDDRLQDMMDMLRNSDPVEKDKPVLVPGDPERMSAEATRQTGAIRYTPDHIFAYRKVAQELQVQPMRELH